MKETSTARHASGSTFSNTTRDLDIVFEESEPQQQQMDDGSMSSPSLNFLRHKVSFPSHYTSNTSEAPSFSIPAVRRARAGTMPSFVQQPSDSNRSTHSSLLLTAIESGRHRSGSLNLPPVDPSYWGLTSDGPLSPSSEQLLQNDNDFSIARTMRSLGLEEHGSSNGSNGNNGNNATTNGNGSGGLFHHPTPPEFLMPSRSLLSGNNRNRSYSVNATARYETEPPPVSRATPVNYMGSLEGFGRQQQNRPRASSMGRADNMSLSMGMWGNGIQRSSPLGSMREEYEQDGQTSLSLGDSELLANMINNNNNNNNTIYEQNDSQHHHHHHQPDNIPYLHYSQSTPTFRDSSQPNQPLPSMSNSTAAQMTTRSLWVGNIDGSVTIDLLTQVFSVYGPIESVRLLTEKECGFVNFYHVEDAIRAKEEILGKMGGRVGTCIVRIGYGKADAAVSDVNTSQPTRALWLGNISGTMTPSSLQAIFSRFGTVESVRVLSHKNCGFVNFELVESAVAARNALVQNETGAQEFAGVRVGFAKVPPPKSPDVNDESRANQVLDTNDIWLKDLSAIMVQLGIESSHAQHFVRGLKTTSSYYDYIPPVPELGSNRKFDAAHLREMRKRSDNAVRGKKEAEAIAAECMDAIAEISSDYIGNTVVQRLFEKCSEETKTAMLERIGPHLAALSIHKNGTWATQKIIALANTPEQILLISHHLKPYIPPLLLDQFGNYAVQCCLNLGDPDRIQFILDAIVEKLMTIAQGRFGARAMRGILENENVTLDQQKFVAASLCQNAASLSTNANGALLLSWLIESTRTEGRMGVVASKLSSHLVQLCTHKLGSQMIYKLINQTEDRLAQEIIVEQLLDQTCLYEILSDQVRGVPLMQKIINCTNVSKEKRHSLSEQVCIQLNQLKGPGHKKLLDSLLEANHDDDTH